MAIKKKYPVCGGAEVSLQSNFATKIVNGQIHSGYIVNLIFKETSEAFYFNASDAARSLLAITSYKMGLTRAEALSQLSILSLTQHVSTLRHDCNDWDAIITEFVGPKRFARYHIAPHVEIKLFKLREI